MKHSPHIPPYPSIPLKENDLPAPEFVGTEPPIYLIQNGPLIKGAVTRLAILLPSRGQVFSRTIESILREVLSVRDMFTEASIFFAHGITIPEAQQDVIRRSLEWGAHITWLVEEDNYMVPGVLKALLFERHHNPINPLVVSCDYYKRDGSGWIVPEWNFAVMKFHAFGCTLVDSEVWRRIGSPYCFLGKCLEFFNEKGEECEPYQHPEKTHAYGGQDVEFSYQLHKLKIPSWHLSRDKWRCGHVSLISLGSQQSNVAGSSIVSMV